MNYTSHIGTKDKVRCHYYKRHSVKISNTIASNTCLPRLSLKSLWIWCLSSEKPCLVMFWNYVYTIMFFKRWNDITSQKPVNLNDLFSWTGLGYGHQVVVLYSSIYYIVILAWAFFYLFSSLRSELPWANCQNPWNTGIDIICTMLSFIILMYFLFFCFLPVFLYIFCASHPL